MSLCLPLRLEHIEFVLQSAEFAHHLVFLSLKLLLRFTSFKLCVLPTLTVLAHPLSVELCFIELRPKFAQFCGILVRLGPQGLQL